MTASMLRASRRSVLAATATMACALAMPAVLRAAPRRLVVGHGAAPGNPRSVAADRFAELVRLYSSGDIDVTVAGAASRGDDAAMLGELSANRLDMSINSQGAASALVPEIAALGLPFLFPDAATAVAACSAEIAERLSLRYQTSGIVLLGFWDNGIRNISNSVRPIVVPGDLSGLKLRTPPDPMTVDIFQSLGATTVQMPFSEVYQALQARVVDGQENPLTNIHSARLYEVNPFISLSAHKWESNPVLLSKATWDGLDQTGKDVIAAASAEAGAVQIQLNEAKNAELLEFLTSVAAVRINACDRDAFRQATASVYDKWLAKAFGPFVQAVIDAARA